MLLKQSSKFFDLHQLRFGDYVCLHWISRLGQRVHMTASRSYTYIEKMESVVRDFRIFAVSEGDRVTRRNKVARGCYRA